MTDKKRKCVPISLCASLPDMELTGMVAAFAGYEPEGWLKCDGQAISRNDYAELFSAIGTIYGQGDGETTFNVPDLRGEFIRGLDNGRGIDDNRQLGSYQKGTYITGDNDNAPSIQSIGKILDVNCDKNHDNYSGIIHHSAATHNESVNACYWGMVRPRNIAMNYCIKY